MSEPVQIGRREREILTAIVETYISTGEPVGSRTLSRGSREGLSAATIRNVMADLSDAGLLDQPHTSAGRVPTAAAYRYYVKGLTGEASLAPAEEGLIKDTFHGVNDMQEFMERTSHVLSLLSQNVGVAVAGIGPKNALEHVHFQRLAESKVLCVVVNKNGIVRDRIMRLGKDIPQLELDAAARFLNENYRGWIMEEIRVDLARRLDQERSEYDRLMHSVEELYKKGALESETTQDVYIEGTSNLVVDDHDRDRLRELLKTLEEKQRLVNLLSAYVDVRQEAVRVVVGLEDTLPHLSNFVLIGAPARVGNEVMGSLAVIGPTRIDYEHTISAVSYIARLFDHIWNDSE
ncbi:heat-inducible transcription repressor HrcA [Candidatus Koribacter versatilis Ellin345]|uniref:Heat-inducible transcription repressor HrcA n=1 Tax=Koribacter versatilis (strain Ellin345) TaxID=204669 RepID=Q1ILK5_KORVE|nr:heat-inducible transcriptional repressor HrcA [Candidatus Koribacter versatilis]ABF42245.1 heat-inducible transcription repressor HrcA [Candidatus Koribacter versatilis Ellin345]